MSILTRIKTFIVRHPHSSILCFTTTLAIIYFSWGINSWKFSFVGDEWPFYDFAREIVIKNFSLNPLSFSGVYQQNSVLVSFYQAIFLKTLGFSNLAWRMSNIILIIPITIFFYYWVRNSFGSSTALFSTLILQSSFYLANFFKIGNIMPQSFILFILCFYFSQKLSQDRKIVTAFLLGIFLGLSFYVYIGPLFPFFVWSYLLFFLNVKNIRQTFPLMITVFVSYILFLMPIFIFSSQLDGPAGKTFLAREYSDNKQILINIFHNFLLFYKNYDYLYNHFVSGPYLDVISRLLAFFGSIFLIFKLKQLPFLQLFLSYLSIVIIIGLTSPYSYAPATRGLFFLPFGFIFAALILNNLRKSLSLPILLAIFVLIFLFNLYQSQIGIFKDAGFTYTSQIIKLMQEIKEKHDGRKLTLVISANSNYNHQNLTSMREAYDLDVIPFYILNSHEWSCPQNEKSTFMILENDFDALAQIYSFNCPNIQPFIKIITAKIPL